MSDVPEPEADSSGLASAVDYEFRRHVQCAPNDPGIVADVSNTTGKGPVPPELPAFEEGEGLGLLGVEHLIAVPDDSKEDQEPFETQERLASLEVNSPSGPNLEHILDVANGADDQLLINLEELPPTLEHFPASIGYEAPNPDDAFEETCPVLAPSDQSCDQQTMRPSTSMPEKNFENCNDQGRTFPLVLDRQAPLSNASVVEADPQVPLYEHSGVSDEGIEHGSNCHESTRSDLSIDDIGTTPGANEANSTLELAVDSAIATGIVQSSPVQIPTGDVMPMLTDSPGNTGVAPIVIDPQILDEDDSVRPRVEAAGDSPTQDMFALDVSSYSNPKPYATEAPISTHHCVADEPTMTQDTTTTVKVEFNDDEGLLRDFVNRAKASKAARIATRTSLSHKHDSDAVKYALVSPRRALEDIDTNSPSPRRAEGFKPLGDKTASPPPSVEVVTPADPDDVDELAFMEPVPLPRRTRRSAAPDRDDDGTNTAKSLQRLTVCRGDGSERVLIKKTEAQEMSILTRNNTRRNRGGAMPVAAMLLKLRGSHSSPQRGSKNRGFAPGDEKRSVKWNEDQLVSFFEGRGSPDPDLENAEKAEEGHRTPSSRPRAKRAKALGAMNGTPSKARNVYLDTKGERASRRQKKDELPKDDSDTRLEGTRGQTQRNDIDLRGQPQAHTRPPQIPARKSSKASKRPPALPRPETPTVATTAIPLDAKEDKENLRNEQAAGKTVANAGSAETKGGGSGAAPAAGAARTPAGARRSMVPMRSSGRLRR